MPRVYDACVIGGGPAGLAAARLMAGNGLEVALVTQECAAVPREHLGQTLASSSSGALRALGLADAFEALHLPPISAVHSSWGSDEPTARTRLEALDGLGWLLDRSAFGRMLEVAAAAAGTRRLSARRARASRSGGHWRIELDGCVDPEIRSYVLIYAGGRRGMMQPPSRRIALDRLVAHVVLVPRHSMDVNDTSIRVDALESGWMFSTAVTDRLRVVTYFTDGDLSAGGELEADPARLISRCRCISSVVNASQAPLLREARRLSATTTFRSTACGSMWIACGDAAQTIDPLSSRGVADALLDGIETGQAILGLLSGEPDAFMCRELSRRRRFAEYLRMRAGQYHAEPRWSAASFWARRNNMAAIHEFLLRSRAHQALFR